LENEPNKPVTKEEETGGDAAAMSARILALQGDSDDYTYDEPETQPSSVIIPAKVKRRGILSLVIGALIVFIIGAITGSRLEKKRIHPAVATVNGEIITAEEFAHASEISSGRATLQRLIDDKLTLQYAKKIGVYPDPTEVDAKFIEVTRTPAFFQNLKRANESPDDYKYTLLVNMCKQAIIGNGIKVNPGEVQDYYKRNIDRNNSAARFYHPETVQAAVIISPSRSALEKAQKEMAGGLPFSAAVLKYSADQSKTHNGVLPALRRSNVPEAKFPGLQKVMFDLQNGNTSDVTQIGKFYWIIKCISHVPETTDPFDKVEDACTSGLLVERGLKTNGDLIKRREADFIKASNITISAEQYADVSPKH
jgi:hypothetical protein